MQAALIKNIEPLLWKYQVNAGFTATTTSTTARLPSTRKFPSSSEPRTIDAKPERIRQSPG